jgi:hypothetical protein
MERVKELMRRAEGETCSFTLIACLQLLNSRHWNTQQCIFYKCEIGVVRLNLGKTENLPLTCKNERIGLQIKECAIRMRYYLPR